MNVGKNDTSAMIPTWQKQQMQQQNMHDFYGNHFGGGDPDSDKKRSYEQHQNATQYQPPFGNQNNGQGVQQKRKDHKFVDQLY